MSPRNILLRAALAAAAGVIARRLVRARHRLDLDGKVAVITGGSRGLGLVMARELVREGARVMLIARDADELERARRQLEAQRAGSVLVRECDVRSADAIAAAIAETVDRLGRVDVLINNAGIIQVGPLQHMTREDFQDAIDTHLWGPLHAMQAVIPHMARQGRGRIVNVSSVGGRIGVPHLAPYSASKFALVGLSDALRAELRPLGIRVTTVCPWLMRTGSHVHAQVKGKHRAEFAWFAISDSLASIDERAAARRILDAARHGDAQLNLGLATRVAVVAQALAPELMSDVMALFHRALPGATDAGGDEARPGAACASAWAPSVLTARADRAVATNNEDAAPAVRLMEVHDESSDRASAVEASTARSTRYE